MAQHKFTLPDTLRTPVLGLQRNLVFPCLAMPINVGLPWSMRAAEAVETVELGEETLRPIFLVGFRACDGPRDRAPRVDELYDTGTLVHVLKQLSLPGKKVAIIIQGLERAEVVEWQAGPDHLSANLRVLHRPDSVAVPHGQLVKLRALGRALVASEPSVPSETEFLIRSIDHAGVLADILASNMHRAAPEAHARAQRLLETHDAAERVEALMPMLEAAILHGELQTQNEALEPATETAPSSP